MNQSVILDTGPLVALLNRRDRYHGWAVETVRSISSPMLTCEAVLSEAFHLLSGVRGEREAILSMLGAGVLEISFQLAGQSSALITLLSRYRDVPMSLADACIVRMSEICANAEVFTLDSDFLIYRRHRRQRIPVIMPPGALA